MTQTTLGQMIDTLLPLGKTLVGKVKEALDIEPQDTPHPRPKPAPETGDWADAGVSVFWAWHAYNSAKNPSETSVAYIDLSNALNDLFTWLPGWDTATYTLKESS